MPSWQFGMTDGTATPSPPQALDLASFEKPILLRGMTDADFERVIELQTRCFPTMKPW